ncbi:hypothetical protein [Streptomyces sp. NBC_01006]|uniref:hypothetical protein n=1 Tax=Streptomyces sp. NBC_01006 TaxID=2903716 RepID=UPI00386B7567|nr:hypothetical protein OG509_19840 [Streptomyces sp. NBC_01006]
MRMKLRPALHYAPVRDGVYFGAEGTSFVVRGPAALFKVTDVCVPLLEDGASENSLVAALGSEAARPVVAKLLETWRRNGLLLDLDALSVPEPDADTRARHRDVLADLEMLHEDPYAAFERLRAATVLVSGPAASVLPAARGLARTGVGRLVLAVPDGDADAVAATADRLGARRLPLTAEGVEVAADAAIVFAPGELLDGVVARQAALLPPDCAIVPVREDGRFHLVGPQTSGAAGRLEAVAARVAGWVKTPSAPLGAAAGALAGALAGQLAYRVLTGTAGAPGESAYVVHGAELNATRVDLTPARPAAPAADLDEAVAHVQAVTAKWTGPFELVTPENLPQLPLGIAEAEHREGTGGSVAAWGGNQRSSSVSVALAALRAQAATVDGQVAAAGTTEERWLLDGTLRLLAERAEPAADAPAFEELDKAAQVLWRTLEDHEFLNVELRLFRVPDVDWPLVLVRDRATGQDVASAWGSGPARAAVAALSTALARVQTRRVRGRELVASGPDTTALLHATDAELAELTAQTRLRLVPHGERAADPVVGETPLWYGAVTGLPAVDAPADTDSLLKEAVA